MGFVVRVGAGPQPVRPVPPDYSGAPRCDHSGAKEVRRQRQSNGVYVAAEQCLTCGSRLRNVPKASVTNFQWLPEFDEALRAAWGERVESFYRDRRAAYEAQLAGHDRAWWDWYSEYLRSAEWAGRRAKVLARDGYRCRGCGDAPATQVHHLTYDRVGNELLFDLVSVCDRCHERCHPRGGE